MLFNSFTFVVFLLIVIPLFLKLPKQWKKPLLLLASYTFYGFWDWRFCFLLMFSTVLDFYIGQNIAKAKNKQKQQLLLSLSIIGNLTILSFFKYFNFFVESFQSLVGQELDYLHLNIILPVGISFYTFQTLSYTIDIYRKKLSPTHSFLDFALFVAFFPQLVAGPIERARNLLPQIKELNLPTRQQLREGFAFITFGLFLKMIIGDSAGKVVDLVFEHPENYSQAELLIAPVLFLIQVYADFAGYSIIARGTAKLVGVELMVNFRQPLLSIHYTDFWRRWHISLYSWFREYVYFSLGGSRKGIFRTYFNIIFVMTLAGLWHGASWNLAIWGLVNGFILAFDKFTNDTWGRPKLNFLSKPVMIFLTLMTFSFTLIVFRTQTYYGFENYMYYLVSDINWLISERVGYTTFTVLVSIFFIEWWYNRHGGDAAFLLKIEPAIRYGMIIAIWAVILTLMFSIQPEPFFYFQF